MIIKSILDQDLYKFSTSYAYMKNFPDAEGTFEFFDRNKTKMSNELVEKIKTEIFNLSALKINKDEFDYLTNAGIALEVKAISTPVFPLIESSGKNLIKLYMSDVGILTGIYYKNNIRAIMDDEPSVNLGTVYESVVASELKAHGHKLYYYDNRNNGEVDFLIDDYDNLSVLPIEVKSGKYYKVHSALNKFVSNDDYHIKTAVVLSNERQITTNGKIIYMPIYFVMFF